MMPVLIQGPKQPGNDINIYLRPLVEELLLLWSKPGVRVWDEYRQEHFDLRALLFVTINDWPALSNLSGQTNKVVAFFQGSTSMKNTSEVKEVTCLRDPSSSNFETVSLKELVDEGSVGKKLNFALSVPECSSTFAPKQW